MRETLLVVEDEFLIRMDISDYLRAQGYEVLEASTAQQAIDLLDKHSAIALVFTDIQMPGPLNGIDLVRYIRARHPGIKTIITSGHLRPSDLPPDVDHLVEKPYLPRRIAALVGEALA
jgi:CheY-like chemotaxis protein